MHVAQGWWRGDPVPVAARVVAIALLGVAVGALGVLRAADDLPMAIALVTMGAATLVHAATRARDAGRQRSRS